MTSSTSLPAFSNVHHRRLRSFLDGNYKATADLFKTPFLLSDLENECLLLESDFTLLSDKLRCSIRKWESRLDDVKEVLTHERSDLLGLNKVCLKNVNSGDDAKAGLEVLAQEINRIETTRVYAETTLRLESLVGDLEDSASQTGANDFRLKNEKFRSAIKSMEDIESVVVSLTTKNNTTQKTTQTWSRLIESVDSRVQSTLSMLKPQALRVHRSILSSINWPPPLASNTETGSAIIVPEFPNPLVLMHGNIKVQFSQSFLALCALQYLQNRRELRQRQCQLNNSTGSLACDLDWNLWAIDELVLPLATRMEKHFCKWSEHPKFIFALVYKTSRDFLDGIETVLQPLIDRARLVGCSVKETWVVSMVRMLSNYLTTRVFPDLVEQYTTMVDDDDEVISKWLNLIDLVISFDKRMMGLASTGILPKGMALPSDFTEESPLPMLLYSIFQDHKPWLQTWAEMELRDVEGKLKSKAESDTYWVIATISDDQLSSSTKSNVESELTIFMLSAREDFKAPPIVDSVLKISWTMIDRCRTLPSIELRLEFIRSSACILLDWFYQVLIQRSERKTLEMDPKSDTATTMIMEDDMLVRLITCINSAGYCESVMEEWSEDLCIIDLSQTHGLFMEEIKNMVKLEMDCLEDIMSSILLEFEVFSRDYIRNRLLWEVAVTANDEQLEPDNVSRLFVECLDMVTVRLQRLKSGLNSKDFADLWRSIALGLDHFIFNSIMLNKMKFSKLGIQQFTVDMKALFCIFKPFCARPESFFPYISDYIKLLLSVSREESGFLTGKVNMSDERIRDELLMIGVSHLSVKQVKKILRRKISDA